MGFLSPQLIFQLSRYHLGAVCVCVCVCVCVRTGVCLVAKSCPTICYRVGQSPPGSSAHGILQAKILECVAISFSRGSSQPRDQSWVSCIEGRFFTIWATIIQFSSDTNYPELSQTLQVKGSVPQDCLPTPDANCKSWVSHTSEWLAINQGFPCPAPRSSIIC